MAFAVTSVWIVFHVALLRCGELKDASRAFEIGILAFIPKDITSYCDIFLLETIYKLALTIVTFRLSNGIEFHNPVHGGSKQRGEREQ